MTRTLPLHTVLWIGFAISTSAFAAPRAIESGIYTALHCQAGDPLCVEKSFDAPIPTLPKSVAAKPVQPPVTLKSEPRRTQDEAARTRSIFRSQPAVEPATPGIATHQDGAGNWEYKFDGDGLSGAQTSGDVVRVRAGGDRIAIDCFDEYLGEFNDPRVSLERVKTAYIKMLHCRNSCTTLEDAKFLTSCVDWSARQRAMDGQLNTVADMEKANNPFSCLPFALDDARRAGKYHGTDQLTNCSPEIVKRASRLQKEFATTHACPQSIANYTELKKYAVQMIRAGYDTTATPTPGAQLSLCGYNESLKQFFSEYNGKFLDPTYYEDSGSSGFPLNCSRMSRASNKEQLFIQQGMTCQGYRSYRNRGEAGDTRFIPIIDKVWLETVTQESPIPGQKGQLYYVGWVFEP